MFQLLKLSHDKRFKLLIKMGATNCTTIQTDLSKWELIETHMLSKHSTLDNKINLEYLKLIGVDDSFSKVNKVTS